MAEDEKKPAAVDVTVCSLSDPDSTSSDVGVEATTEDGNDHRKRKDFLRKRNALYARRKYARRKIETDVLQEQCLQLEESNHHLKLEENRLKALLERARQVVQVYNQTHAGNIFATSITAGAPLSCPLFGTAESILMQELARQQANTAVLHGRALPLLPNNSYLPLVGTMAGMPNGAVAFNSQNTGATLGGSGQAMLAGLASGYPSGPFFPPSDMLSNLLLRQQLEQQIRQQRRQSVTAKMEKGEGSHRSSDGYDKQK